MELLHCYVYFLLCVCVWFEGFFFFLFLKKVFISLAAPGLSYGMWDLYLWHANS